MLIRLQPAAPLVWTFAKDFTNSLLEEQVDTGCTKGFIGDLIYISMALKSER